jgi:hypothetical protein
MPTSQALIPILLAAEGRSGTTALMALLGTDPRVAFDRVYPYENRYLTWLAKAAQIVGRPVNSEVFIAEQLFELADDRLGPMPRSMEQPASLMPSATTWTTGLWSMFTEHVRKRDRSATYYAEKSPFWLAALLRQIMAVRVVNLVRDPRDVFVSARKFISSVGRPQFGLTSDMSEIEQARETAHRWLVYAENELADQVNADTLLIRYEDWIQQPRETASRLGQFLNLELRVDAPELARDHVRHSTSGKLESSVSRWQREPLADSVNARLVGLLAEHLDRYGYERPKGITPIQAIVPDPEWTHSVDGEWKGDSASATVLLNGSDAWIELPSKPFAAESVTEVWMCARCETGDHCSVFWRVGKRPFAESRAIHVPFHPGPHWQVVRFRVGQHRKWRGTIEQVRVDVCNGKVAVGQPATVRWLRYIP